MNYFLIRHKETKKLMPQYKSGKGYSHWLADEIVDNQLPVPRLIDTRKKAEKIIVEWAKGIYKWEQPPKQEPMPNLPEPDPYGYEWKPDIKVFYNLGRTKDMLEVVEVEIKEIVWDGI